MTEISDLLSNYTANGNKSTYVIVCTSSTRPENPLEGQHIYETDTDKTLKNVGTTSSPAWINADINIHSAVADLTACKAIAANERYDKMLLLVESLGLYRWDAQSTTASDDSSVIRPTDIESDETAGRWARIYFVATTENDGLMSAADKTKLDGIATGATNTPLSTATPTAETVGDSGSAGSSSSASKADHKHPMPGLVTTDAHGFMASNDKALLGEISGLITNLGIFDTVAVVDSGGSSKGNAVAESRTDTLTLKEGSNITLAVNELTDTVTISSSGGIGFITTGLNGDGSTDNTTALSDIFTAHPNGGTIFFAVGTYVIDSNLTFPAGYVLYFDDGAMISPTTGKTVTINCIISAGLQQIFTGDGTVVGNIKNKCILPEWWGAVGDASTDDTSAIQKAINLNIGATNPKPIYLTNKYKTTDQLTATYDCFSMAGDGVKSEIMFYPQAINKNGLYIYSGSDLTQINGHYLRDFTFSCQQSQTGTIAINFRVCGNSKVRNVRVWGGSSYATRKLYTCIKVRGGSDYQIDDCRLEGADYGLDIAGFGATAITALIEFHIMESYIWYTGTAINIGVRTEGFISADTIIFDCNTYCVAINGTSSASPDSVFKFFGMDFDTAKGGLYLNNANAINISNCWFSNLNGDNSFGAILTKNVDGFTACNNKMYLASTLPGFVLGTGSDYHRNFTIVGNELYSGLTGIDARVQCYDGSIVGNSIQGCTTGIDFSASPHDINLAGNHLRSNTTNYLAGAGVNIIGEILGVIYGGTHSVSADAPITGYVTIVDSGGTTRKLAVIS